jgi:hypothetical protein
MIVSLHVAIGGCAGLVTRSRLVALLLGPTVHLAADRIPHQDIPDRRFEIASGLACIGLLAARHGPLDPVTLGAVSSSAPDLEHVLPRLRPGGRMLFHDPGERGRLGGRLPTSVQLLLAGVILGRLLALPRTPPARS